MRSGMSLGEVIRLCPLRLPGNLPRYDLDVTFNALNALHHFFDLFQAPILVALDAVDQDDDAIQILLCRLRIGSLIFVGVFHDASSIRLANFSP